MSRVSGSLARRIDQLSRSAHQFHRFAHHPLCSEYAGELVHIGGGRSRMRICRGCAFVALGAGGGLGLSLVLPAAPRVLIGILLVAVSWLAHQTLGGGQWPARPAPRTPKLLSRLAPSCAIAFALGHAVRIGWPGLAPLGVLAGSLGPVVVLYRRRGPDRTPCASCPERLLAVPCRGVAPVVRRERAFRRLAGQWMRRAGVDRTRA